MNNYQEENSLDIAFLTLGCKVNAYETEKMKEKFEMEGHRIVSFEEKADVYIINTCTVTNIADRKSRKMLHRARRKNPDAIVVAAGCYVDSAKKKGEKDEAVDVFLSNQEKEDIVNVVIRSVLRKKGLPKMQPEVGERIKPERSPEAQAEEHTRAYLKVQNGCNQYCTYCIIPYVRGPLTSKPINQVCVEVETLAAAGIKEVVLTGIHLSSYGVDHTDKKNFLELEGKPLLELIHKVAGVSGIERVRLGSLEPRIITDAFVKELSEIPEVCPHFHLSLQSGCDATLKRMNRHYSSEEYMKGVNILRSYYTNPAITTDVIVGFPKETDEGFLETCNFVKKVGFAQIHVFKYSRRQGTMADAMDGQIEESLKAERSDRLIEIEESLAKDYHERFIGHREKVLWEETTEIEGKLYLVGYTARYVRVGMEVSSSIKPEEYMNRITSIRISSHLTKEVLLGENT